MVAPLVTQGRRGIVCFSLTLTVQTWVIYFFHEALFLFAFLEMDCLTMQERAECNMKRRCQHFLPFSLVFTASTHCQFCPFFFFFSNFNFFGLFFPTLIPVLLLSPPPLPLQCIPCGRDPSRYQEVNISLPLTSLCERASTTRSWSLWSPNMTRRPASKSGTTVTPFWWSMMTLPTSPVSTPNVFKSPQCFLLES